MAELAPLLDDLAAEGDGLDALVASLDLSRWATPTPAPGWTIAHQIAHLAWTDEQALLATTDPDEFTARFQAALAAGTLTSAVDDAATAGAGLPPTELLTSWRAGRASLRQALGDVPAGQRLVWFGPPMNVASMATARLMETWAHGEDVAAALGITREPTARLRHVAHIGVRTRDFAYHLHGLTPPAAEFRVELVAPDGEQWAWGPGDAPDRVIGSALDFCLLATQRTARSSTGLTATGEADHWLDIVQAFAGPPGAGR